MDDETSPRIAYLIDQWPDQALPWLETELSEVAKRTSGVQPFVCDFGADQRLSGDAKRLALQFEFLPDAMAIEAEWQANREFVLALEDDRANESHRAPVDLFLRQARFALTLRRMFAQRKICHVHATSSRALICGVLLKKMLGVSLSASIEAKPAMSREAIENALQHAVGGRIANRKLSEQIGRSFLFRSCRVEPAVRARPALVEAGQPDRFDAPGKFLAGMDQSTRTLERGRLRPFCHEQESNSSRRAAPAPASIR